MRLVTLTFGLLTLAVGSTAEAGSPIDSCSAIKSSTLRLACFDKQANNVEQPSSQNGNSAPTQTNTSSDLTTDRSNDPSDWIVHTSVNLIDDTPTVTAALIAEDGQNRDGVSPTLVIRCKSKKLEAYIIWKTFLGSDFTRVTTRVDDRPATTERWSISNDHVAAFAVHPSHLIRDLASSVRFVVSVVPYSESGILAAFKLSGAKVATNAIVKECPNK